MQKPSEVLDASSNSFITKPLEREFGGPWGALCIVIFSHFILYYLWVSLTYYQGSLIIPTSLKDISLFLHYIQEGATPTIYAVIIYLGFIFFQFLLAYFMPGLCVKGLPVPSEGHIQHTYICNGIASWYVTLLVIGILHMTGVFPLSEFADHLGPLISVAIIVADSVALSAYLITMFSGSPSHVSNNRFYDFFIGVVLNPRIGKVDLKFFAEIRIAWILLFLLTLSAATKQYTIQGTITWPMIFMVIAHALYTNACMKGEECIPTTWDIFHEKWGWMLIFWNFAGVPFVYSFQSFYILKNNPHYPFIYTILLFIVLLTAYYIWDTSQSQKNRFRMQLKGTYVPRRAFPQLPWGTLNNPHYIETATGDALLVDGWWRYARKIHYSADVVMAITWGLSCGIDGILPYFYPLFFLSMIIHRYHRDSKRCSEKYAKDWKKYCEKVPYRFIPFIF